MRSFCASFVAAWVIAASTLTAANWPGFRGPNSSGVGSAEALPLEFGPGKNVVWKTDLPTGKSSPVLTEKHIFLTAWTAGQPVDVGVGSPHRRVALEERGAARA